MLKPTNDDEKSAILIADDDEGTRRTIQGLLFREGYDLHFAADGPEALEKAAELRPDLVLLDVMMPGMDGLEVCQRLRGDASLAEVPVIMISVLDNPGARLDGINAGADDFISKPFDSAELRARIRTVLRLNRYRRLHAERNRFEKIVELSPDGIVIVSSDRKITLANPAFRKMLRTEGDPERLHRDIFTFVRPDFHEHCLSCFSKIITEMSVTCQMETRFVRFDGTDFPAEVSAAFLEWEHHGHIQMVIRDMSRIRQTQAELMEKERLYRTLTESVADGVILVKGGRVVFANPAFGKLVGVRRADDIVGRRAADFFDLESLGRSADIFGPVEIEIGAEREIRSKCVASEGRRFWLSIHASIIQWASEPAALMVCRDIDRAVRREEEMAREVARMRKENVSLRGSMRERYRLGEIIGKSLAMQQVYERILKAAQTDASVLITGESGTGKELVAGAIHGMSELADRPFVPVNCGAVAESLAESEFFGHRKGAFTGADREKVGYLAAAHGGTLFLDEIGELNLALQVKLLRALESGEYMAVGDTEVRRARFRLISATRWNPHEMVAKGRMRDDFFYRIGVLPIRLPALRERKEDIPLLVEHFMKRFRGEAAAVALPAHVMERLLWYHWPGNVRELRGVIHRYLAMGELPESLSASENEDEPSRGESRSAKVLTFALHSPEPEEVLSLADAMARAEKDFILRVLQRNQWHRGKSAAVLGIDPKTLYLKMKKLGLI